MKLLFVTKGIIEIVSRQFQIVKFSITFPKRKNEKDFLFSQPSQGRNCGEN